MKYKDLAKLEGTFSKLTLEEQNKRLIDVLDYFVKTNTADGSWVVEVTKNYHYYQAMQESGNV